jgi:hypothetical protein
MAPESTAAPRLLIAASGTDAVNVDRRKSRMSQQTWRILSILAAFAALAAGALAYREHAAIDALKSERIGGELRPIAQLLQDDRQILAELHATPFAEGDADVLESYLIKIRKDGVAKHSDMKQRLDALAENTVEIVALIKAYSPHARTAAFTTASDRFREYAAAWRDRWNSVMELFMAGGNYAKAAVAFPNGFAAAVDAEINAAN